jgi:hypothetical protein
MSYLSLLKGSLSLTVGGMDKLINNGVTLNEGSAELEMWHEVPGFGKRHGGTGLWHHPVIGELRPHPVDDEREFETKNYSLTAFMALASKTGAVLACNLTRLGEEPGDFEQWHAYEFRGTGLRVNHWHSIETPIEGETP